MRKFLLVLLAVAILAALVLWSQGSLPSIPSDQSSTDQSSADQGNTDQGTTEDGGIPSSGIPAAATEATIDYVHDGDTVFLGDRTKVRLLGINTPEIGDNRECYGEEATAALRALLPVGSHVWVLADVEEFDQYGRSLLFIYTDDGTNVNLELLEIGAAEVEQYSPNFLFSDQLHSAENAAHAADLGLWGVCR